MGNGDGTGTRSDAGGSCDRVGPDGHANWSDVLSGHRDVPDICNGTDTTADAMETISTHQNSPKMQDLPIKVQRRDEVEPRSCAGMPNMWEDTQGIAIYANMAGDTKRCISTGPADSKPPDLPARSARPCRDKTDRFESLAGMQTACIHVQDVEDKSNQPMNTLVTMDLPAGAEWRMGEPGRLETQ